MKRIICLLALFLTHHLSGYFHFGAGFSWNTIDEIYDSTLITDEDRSGRDKYEASRNRLAPFLEVSCQMPVCKDWLFGVLADWKFLNYETPNVNSSRGQILPNATFSSINIFGEDVHRDFTSKTSLINEFKFLGYLGKQLIKGYAYIGIGPVLYNATNRIYVSSVHIPNGVGDHLISTSATSNKTIWGGALRLGYQLCFNPNFFVNLGYGYSETGRNRFNNTVNAAILNGADEPGPTTLFLKRKIKFRAQELLFSVNLLF